MMENYYTTNYIKNLEILLFPVLYTSFCFLQWSTGEAQSAACCKHCSWAHSSQHSYSGLAAVACDTLWNFVWGRWHQQNQLRTPPHKKRTNTPPSPPRGTNITSQWEDTSELTLMHGHEYNDSRFQDCVLICKDGYRIMKSYHVYKAIYINECI